MTVIDNAAEHRFELVADGHTAVAMYVREGDRIVFTHTIVPPELEGRGIGTRLVAGALEQVRTAGLRVVPQCPFVAAYLEKHPEAAKIA